MSVNSLYRNGILSCSSVVFVLIVVLFIQFSDKRGNNGVLACGINKGK